VNAQTDDTRATWRAQIESLTARIAEAEQGVTDARNAASDAALTGGDLDAATRDLALARDRLDALRTARGEAERHLAAADAAHAQRERDRAFARAQALARKRIATGDQFDAFARELDPAFAQWVAQSAALSREMAAAGQRPISGEGRDYRIRAALWASAPALMTAIGAPRVSADHRETLRQISAAQAAPILAKGE
jgi:hypothetical protein